MRSVILVTSISHGRSCNISESRFTLNTAIATLFSLRLRTLYLNRYLRVLSLLLCSSVYGGAVWFHFTSARPRDGLASFASRSLTSTSRLSSSLVLPRLPRTLVFPVLPLRLFFLLGSYRPQVFLVAFACSFLSEPSDL